MPFTACRVHGVLRVPRRPPGEPQGRFFVPAAEHAAQWGALLETVLSFVGGNLGEGTDVRVDDNYSVFLCEAVRRCFTEPFRRVRTKEDDGFTIRRGLTRRT